MLNEKIIKTINTDIPKLRSDLADIVKYNLLKNGGNADGITPNDSAFVIIRDEYKKVYLPQNETKNAIYYFTNTQDLNNVEVTCDKNVKISFPTTNNYSLKKVIFKNDISIISRDRDNTGIQYQNDNSKLLPSTLSQNDIEIGMKKLTSLDDSKFEKKVYLSNGGISDGTSLIDIDSSGLYKVTETLASSIVGKMYTLQTDIELGYMYNCVYAPSILETDNSCRVGIILSNGSKFISYTSDMYAWLYTGIYDTSWSEVKNTKYLSLFTEAYKMRNPIIMSCRVINNNTFEIYINGIKVETVTSPFGCSKIGFCINGIVGVNSGINNYFWGDITKSKLTKSNNGNTYKAFVSGDSITFGEGSFSWAEYLPTFLEGQRGITKFEVTNGAVSGERVDAQLSRMKAKDLTPFDIIMIMIGTNDIQAQTPIATFKSTLQEMITLAKANNRKVIVGIPPMFIGRDVTGTGFSTVAYQKGAYYRNVVMKMIADNDLILADTLSELGRIGLDNHNYVLRDNIHPLPYGEVLLARCFARSIIYALNIDIENEVSANSPSEVITVVEPTLQNGWVNFGELYTKASFYKVGREVKIQGLIKSGTTNGGTVIFQLPLGYRPSGMIMCPSGSNGGTGYEAGTIEINSIGEVKCSVVKGNTWLSLTGISFLV